MVSIDYDLRYLRAGVDDLQAYLLSEVLYWPVGVSAPAGEPAYPSLTLGNLLLSRMRLQGRALAPQAQRLYGEACTQMEAIHQRWRSAWERKAGHSFHARLEQWQAYLADYRGQPSEHANRYAYEVRLRLLLALLQPELEAAHEPGLTQLAALDKILRAVFIQGDFIWEPELAPAFPAELYWFLYGGLRK